MAIYDNDKLNRKEFVDKIIKFIKEFGDRNLTCLLNGQFGSGKSTVLNYLKQQIESEDKYNCLFYNVWENNLFDNPLIPLLDCFNELKTNKDKFKAGAIKIIKNLPKLILSTLANAHSIDLTSLTNNECVFDEYNTYKTAISEYKKLLEETCKLKKVVLLIDELDRCLPEYQIKVLETVYHLLDIPQLIIIIAIDKSQLYETIKQKLGEEVNVYGYLSKFIDYEFELPSDSYGYVNSLITVNNESEVIELCTLMYKSMNYQLRDCIKIVNELNLVCKSVEDYWVPIFINLILIIKKSAYKIYIKYFITCPNIMQYENKSLKDTKFQSFLNDIEKYKTISNLINMILNVNGYGSSFMFHLINYFHDIRMIDKNDLAKYLKNSPEEIESIIKNSGKFIRAYQFQHLLNRISLLI